MTELAQNRIAPPERDRRKRVTIDMDVDVHQELKMEATRRKTSIREYVLDAVMREMQGGNSRREAS